MHILYGVAMVTCFMGAGAILMWTVIDRRKSEPIVRLYRARQQVRQILRETERKMNRASGHDPFNFGRRDDW